jgi:hypothetical protein
MAPEPSLETLAKLTLADLKNLWQTTYTSTPTPRLKPLLLRELAWGLQTSAQGGLDPDTRRLLRAAIRNAHVASSGARSSRKNSVRASQKPQLSTGALLVRTWKGRRHEVTVLDHGKRFSYLGETYDSLSAIAEKITSVHWSGPRFFGLRRLGGSS